MGANSRISAGSFMCLLVALLAGVHIGSAQWWSEPTPVCTASNLQVLHQIVSDGSGGVIICWDDWRSNPTTTSAVYAQRFDAAGVALWSVNGILVVPGTSSDPTYRGVTSPVLVGDGHGGAFIVWHDKTQVKAQRLSPAGQRMWPSGVVIATGYNPTAVSDGADGIIVAWCSSDPTSAADVLAQRFDGNGQPKWGLSDVPISRAPAGQVYPKMIMDNSGGAIVAWYDSRVGYPAWDIYAQRVDSGGRVQWQTDGVPVCVEDSTQMNPVLSSDGGNGAYIGWRDFRGSTVAFYAQRIDGAGAARWTPGGVKVANGPNGELTPDGFGGVVAVYQGGATRIESSGNPAWKTNDSGIGDSPQILGDMAGGAIVASNMYVQRLSSSGSLLWTAPRTVISGGTRTVEVYPMLAMDGIGGAVVAWQRHYGGVIGEDCDLFARRVGSRGEWGSVVPNYTFEQGALGWTFYTNGSGSFTPASGGVYSPMAGKVSILGVGSNTQLYQQGVVLEPYTRYRLTFSAYSSSGHDLSVYLHRHDSPYTGYGLDWWDINLGTTWQTFYKEFTTAGFENTVDNARLRFWFSDYASAGDVYYIDDVILEKVLSTSPVITAHPQDQTVGLGQSATFKVVASGADPLNYQWQRDDFNIPGATEATYVTPPVTYDDDVTTFRCIVTNVFGSTASDRAMLKVTYNPNLVQDGGFNSTPSPWVFYTNAAGTFSLVPVGGVSGPYGYIPKVGRAAIEREGTNVQLYQSDIALQPYATYQLTFTAYSNRGHNVSVSLLKHTTPYTSYGLSDWIVDLTPDLQSFTKVFSTSGFEVAVNDARLMFWLAPFDAAGDEFSFDDVVLQKISFPKADLAGKDKTPEAFLLRQNYPNPFNPTTTIGYALPVASHVSLKIYNTLGQEVATLLDEEQEAGEKSVQFNASSLPSGVYVYRLVAGNYQDMKKLILVR